MKYRALLAVVVLLLSVGAVSSETAQRRTGPLLDYWSLSVIYEDHYDGVQTYNDRTQYGTLASAQQAQRDIMTGGFVLSDGHPQAPQVGIPPSMVRMVTINFTVTN